MTAEEWEEIMLQTGALHDAQPPPVAPAAPTKPDRRLTVAPIPSSMHGNDLMRGPWGHHD